MTRAEEVKAQMKASEGVATPMPRYRCHKEVWALKIAELLDPTEGDNERDGSALMVPVDQGFGAIRLSHDFMRKHKPIVGGYFVQYQDGYTSFSPAAAFEEGYSRI